MLGGQVWELLATVLPAMKLVRRFLDLPAFLIGVFLLYWCAYAAHVWYCCNTASPAEVPLLTASKALRRLSVRRSLPLAVMMNQVKFWKLTGKCALLLVHANSNAQHPFALGACLANSKGSRGCHGARRQTQ